MFFQKNFTTSLVNKLLNTNTWEIQVDLNDRPESPTWFLLLESWVIWLEENIFYHRVSWNSVFCYWVNRSNPVEHQIWATVNLVNAIDAMNYILDNTHEQFYIYKKSITDVIITWWRVYQSWLDIVVPTVDTSTWTVWQTLSTNTTNYVYVELGIIKIISTYDNTKYILSEIDVDNSWNITAIRQDRSLMLEWLQWIQWIKWDIWLSATINIWTVTTWAAWSNASVSNVGTVNNAIFDLVIPRWNTGADSIVPTYTDATTFDYTVTDWTNGINWTWIVNSVVWGTNITVDNTDPLNPILNANWWTAAATTTYTTNFNNNLSATDTDVQKALDTLDNIVIWWTPLPTYTITNTTTDRVLDTNNTTLNELANVLWTHIADTQTWLIWPTWPTWPAWWVTSVSWKTWAVTLVKWDVGLWSVDNTTDLDKPISTLTQTALDGKQANVAPWTSWNVMTSNWTVWQSVAPAWWSITPYCAIYSWWALTNTTVTYTHWLWVLPSLITFFQDWTNSAYSSTWYYTAIKQEAYNWPSWTISTWMAMQNAYQWNNWVVSNVTSTTYDVTWNWNPAQNKWLATFYA